MFYLDNAATTIPLDCVCDKHAYAMKGVFGNPSSLYSIGVTAEREMNSVRDSVATKLKVDSKNLFFTSSATESNNLAIQGVLGANSRKKGHIICSSIEHPSVFEVYKMFELNGWDVDYIPVLNDGTIDLNSLTDLIKPETILISVMAVNNEIGSIQPIDKIKPLIKKAGSRAILHVDAVQAFGKIKIFPKKQGIDILTVSSHKIYGPKGVSCIYVSDSIKFKPIIFGGAQEKGVRSGTENVPAIISFGVAVDYMYEHMEHNYILLNDIKVKLLDTILNNVNKVKPILISNDTCVPYIISISFPGIRSEVLLHHLEQRGVYVSSGSACTNNKSGKSYVLKEMGYENNISDSVIRISPSINTTLDDIVVAGEIIAETVNSLIN